MRAVFEKVPTEPERSFRISARQLSRFDAPWHFHPEVELTLILESEGRRFVGDHVARFSPGDLVLLGPNLPHFWHNDPRAKGAPLAQSIVVQFLPDFLGSEFFTKPELAPIGRLLDRAARGLHFNGATAERAAAQLRTLPERDGLPALLTLLDILRVLASSRSARPLASAAYQPRLDHKREARLARVYAFLSEHFHEPLSLAEIARVAAMAPSAFSRYFRRATGRNVSHFLNELRVDRATRMLAETNFSVARIAAEAGFPTLSNFNRRFRERMQCTPRDYRRVLTDRA